jgi:hypothetical protein
MDTAFKFYEQQDIATEESYRYKMRNGVCQHNFDTAIPKGSLTGYKDVKGEDGLLDAVSNQGPISVPIEADQRSFQLYKGGVITKGCGKNLDHGVLTVGYGTDNGVDYWKIKNSWGTSFGEDGFVRIKRDVNMCGIAGEGTPGRGPSYPVVSGSPTPPTPTPTPTPTPPPPTPPAPTPPAPTPTPPSPAPPGQHHYGKPGECLDDEDEFVVPSFTPPGSRVACAPQCNVDDDCPQDGSKNPKPGCLYGENHCVLICGLGGGKCPQGAACEGIGITRPGQGICSYRPSSESDISV